MTEDHVRVPADALRSFCQTVFERAGVPSEAAVLVADALIDADLRGVSTHGLVRFPLYVTRVRQRLINPTPDIRVVRERGATVVLDGDDGFGQVIGVEGMRRAVELAHDQGVGLCGMRNSNHLGALAYVAARAVAHRMIGIVMTITNPVIAPWGGVVPKLGNNPLAIAVPTDRDPIILDMACSEVARGNLILAGKMGKAIPTTWALDSHGKPTDDPVAGLKGSLMPVGGHKGAGLALIVGILGGLLAGAPFGAGCGDIFDMTRPQRLGHLAMAIDVSACCPLPDFLEAVGAMVEECKTSPRADGVSEIVMPGELEARRRERNLREGFPVSRVVLDEAKAVGRALDVPWPL